MLYLSSMQAGMSSFCIMEGWWCTSALLVCIFLRFDSAQATCTQGAIRLQGGNATSGRVEICNNNIWGTVCDDEWGYPDAQVVCRQLGFIGIDATALTTGFANGAGQIWLDNVQCYGTETRLIDCIARGTNDCYHFEDAGVTCGSMSLNNSSTVLIYVLPLVAMAAGVMLLTWPVTDVDPGTTGDLDADEEWVNG